MLREIGGAEPSLPPTLAQTLALVSQPRPLTPGADPDPGQLTSTLTLTPTPGS